MLLLKLQLLTKLYFGQVLHGANAYDGIVTLLNAAGLPAAQDIASVASTAANVIDEMG